MSKYFTTEELNCNCGCGLDKSTPLLREFLDYVRGELGKPVYVNSGTRCAKHNRAIGGAPYSQHLLGTAADIRCDSVSPQVLYRLLDERFPHSLGLGNYETFTHVDVRKGCARW